MTYWLLFILLFGVVVFIHELGHFLAARFSGVHVERFAIGFGPILLRKRIGETEYALCALPLGGYVKMRGEDPEDGTKETAPPDPRSFASARLRSRMGIVLSGPLANLILPVIVFSGIFMSGLPTLTSDVGWVAPRSPAEAAGILPGDGIETLDGRPMWRWSDMNRVIEANAGRALSLSVRRDGKLIDLEVVPRPEQSVNAFGESVVVGRIGISPTRFRPAIGVSNPRSPAAQAGLNTGDVVTAVNGNPVNFWWRFEEVFVNSEGAKVLTLERNTGSEEEPKVETFTATLPHSARRPVDAGIEPGELFLKGIMPGSVAEAKGLAQGDRLVSVNGEAIESWLAFSQLMATNTGESLNLTVLREGREVTTAFVPEAVEDRDKLTRQRQTRRQLGVISAATPASPSLRIERHLNPLPAFARAVSYTAEMTAMTVTGLWKLLTGRLSLRKSVGGPITIFFLAGGSYDTGGWVAFFKMMALLSITLGIINLFPIPVLDGGHIAFFMIEGIRGRPLGLRVREAAQHVGFIFIIGLMVLVFFVDIERYFLDRIRGLFN